MKFANAGSPTILKTELTQALVDYKSLLVPAAAVARVCIPGCQVGRGYEPDTSKTLSIHLSRCAIMRVGVQRVAVVFDLAAICSCLYGQLSRQGG